MYWSPDVISKFLPLLESNGEEVSIRFTLGAVDSFRVISRRIYGKSGTGLL